MFVQEKQTLNPKLNTSKTTYIYPNTLKLKPKAYETLYHEMRTCMLVARVGMLCGRTQSGAEV